jgi:hypothetical protein
MKSYYMLIACALLSACNAGSGEGLNEAGQPVSALPDQPQEPDVPVEPDGIQPNLASIQENVLTPICAQCHFGNNAPLGLRMDNIDASITNLIDVDSATNSTFKRVLPGDAENSFFYLKITGAAIAGNQMPLGQSPLDANTQNVIRQWIDSGAPLSAQQLTVAAKIETLASQQAQLNITFSQPMLSHTIQNSDVVVQSFSGDHPLAIEETKLRLDWTSSQTLSMSFTDIPVETQVLEFTLNRSSISTVLSQSGNQLDGDMDGIEGGEFHYEINMQSTQ